MTVADMSIDYNAPASVADKLDGALGIGVRVNGDYIIATKGSFRSDESIEGTVFMRTKHDSRAFADFMDKNLPRSHHCLKSSRRVIFHVVQYGKLADIVFLGLLENATGWWIPAALLGVDERTADRNAVLIPGKSVSSRLKLIPRKLSVRHCNFRRLRIMKEWLQPLTGLRNRTCSKSSIRCSSCCSV